MTNAMARYAQAVFSQGFVSAAHFVLQLLLVRLLPAADYGLFALAFSVAMILAAVTNALFTVPLSVLRPGASAESQRTIERDLNTPAIASGLAFGLLMAIGGALFAGDPMGAVAAAAFIATFVVRHHFRGAGFARFAVGAVLRGDFVYVLVAAGGVAMVLSADADVPSVAGALWSLAVANVVSIVVLSRQSEVSARSLAVLGSRYRPYWSTSKWVLVGAVSTMIVTQGHGVVITALDGAEAFAPIAAGFVLFGPVRVLFATVQNLLRPEMAKAIAEGDDRLAFRMASSASLVCSSIVVIIGIVLAGAWSFIGREILDEQYRAAPMAWIVLAWGIVSLIAAVQVGPNAVLQAELRFEALARVALVAGTVNLVLVTAAVLVGPTQWAIPAVGVAETLMTVWTVALMVNGQSVTGTAERSST